jgi:hypothetical protein
LSTVAITTDRAAAHRAPGAGSAAILLLGTTGYTLSYDALRGGK